MADRSSRIKLENSIGQVINPATDESVLALVGSYTTYVDTTSTANTIYIGNAAIGSTTSSAVWQISKVDTTGISIKWAAGSSAFSNVWDSRVSLTYS